MLSSIPFALQRLWSHRWLALFLLCGLAAAAALTIAVPLYADGVNYKLLNAALAKSAAQTRRSPFDFIFHYVGSWHEPITVEQYTPVDIFMREQVAGVIGLPLNAQQNPAMAVTRYAATDSLQLYPQAQRIVRSKRLDLVRITFVSALFDHIRVVEGRLPGAAASEAAENGDLPAIEALVALNLANELGLEVGQTYLLYKPAEGAAAPYRQPVVISGLWVAADESSEFWSFYAPASFDKKLLVTEDTFFGAVASSLPLPINEAAWRVACDGSAIHSEEVAELLARIDQAQIRTAALLPNTDLETSPVQALRQFRRQVSSLTGLLFVFSAPVLSLALYFMGYVASMLVRRQRNEIAVLRSRGATRVWVTTVYLLEWGLLGAAALSGGAWLGTALARLIGQTRSFLDFNLPISLPGDFPIRLTQAALGSGAAAVGMALLLSLLPAWQAGRDTIVSYKLERSRSRQRPLWQRMVLDVLLLLPSVYGLYTLRVEGRLTVFGRAIGSGAAASSANPLENPVLFLLPALFVLGLSLLFLRLLPALLSALAWLAGQLNVSVPVLALRQLARAASSGTTAHLGPLLLMILTLSLAGFVASMAHTLDASIADSVYYAVGADLNLAEGGEYTGETSTAPNTPNQPGAPSTPTQDASGDPALWNFLPISDHLALPGVLAAARFGHYEAELQAGGRSASGLLLGIDRTDFPGVAFFRPDFSSEPLVGLMNRLAFDPAALLVDRATWERFNLSTGDTVEIQAQVGGQLHTTAFKLAGLLDYFPTQYAEDSPFFLANLDYLFESWGGLQPYDVWLRTAPDADPAAIVRGINSLGIAVITAQDARLQLAEAYAAPSRQGMLGLLSIGFLAASFLTVIGFGLYTSFSFQERFVQLGVLRAIGLSVPQMGAALALEQIFLIGIGLAAGTGIAVLASWLFIPHLPATIGSHPGVPPYVVTIAWNEIVRVYLLFGGMLLVGVLITLFMLTGMKLFQAVKMGENV